MEKDRKTSCGLCRSNLKVIGFGSGWKRNLTFLLLFTLFINIIKKIAKKSIIYKKNHKKKHKAAVDYFT